MTEHTLSRRAPLGRPPKYPWNAWTDGQEHTIEYGVHFGSMPDSMAVLLRKHAKNYGLEVSVSVNGDFVTFQFADAA